MPQGYGFLKYGRPMVAAAPLLLGLTVLPGPAQACTGAANDPKFCSQVNNQFVTGMGEFIDENLTGVPGGSPIPGSTPALDDDNDLDFTSPIDDDNDLDFVFVGEDEFTDTGFVRTPLAYPEPLFGGVSPGLAFDPNTITNTSVGAGTPITTIPIAGIPEFQGTVPADPGGTPPITTGGPYQFYSVSPTGPDPSRFSIVVSPGGDSLSIVSPDGTLPAPIGTLVEESQGTESGGGSCDLSVAACKREFSNFYISVTNFVPPENVAPVLNALANGSPSTAPLDTGDALINGPDASPDDSNGLREHYELALASAETSTTSTSSGGSSDDSAGDAYVQRQVASITKLREEVANAPDPETRQQKQAELQRKEAGIRLYGSAALRNALGLGDARSAPVPGRN